MAKLAWRSQEIFFIDDSYQVYLCNITHIVYIMLPITIPETGIL